MHKENLTKNSEWQAVEVSWFWLDPNSDNDVPLKITISAVLKSYECMSCFESIRQNAVSSRDLADDFLQTSVFLMDYLFESDKKIKSSLLALSLCYVLGCIRNDVLVTQREALEEKYKRKSQE